MIPLSAYNTTAAAPWVACLLLLEIQAGHRCAASTSACGTEERDIHTQ